LFSWANHQIHIFDQEEGAEEVGRLLEAARSHTCQIVVRALSLIEIYYVALQEQGEDEAARLLALVKAWPVTWIYPDERTLLQAARIKASYHLSFVDAVIAATAKLQQATLVHKDPELVALATEVALLNLPFKKKTSHRVPRQSRRKPGPKQR
jgi:uncharacterized protein